MKIIDAGAITMSLLRCFKNLAIESSIHQATNNHNIGNNHEYDHQITEEEMSQWYKWEIDSSSCSQFYSH